VLRDLVSLLLRAWFRKTGIYRSVEDVIGIFTNSWISSMARFQALGWLEHSFPFCWSGIYFGPDKGVLELDVMIDDKSGNLDVSSTWRVLLFDQPWNWHIDGYERVRSWKEVTSLL